MFRLGTHPQYLCVYANIPKYEKICNVKHFLALKDFE
jgi:hypothetical protein